MTHTDEVKRIAEGLSEAQQALLLDAGDSIDNDYWLTGSEKRSAKVLQNKGLGRMVDTSHKPNGILVYWNNPLGLSVREYLQTQEQGDV